MARVAPERVIEPVSGVALGSGNATPRTGEGTAGLGPSSRDPGDATLRITGDPRNANRTRAAADNRRTSADEGAVDAAAERTENSAGASALRDSEPGTLAGRPPSATELRAKAAALRSHAAELRGERDGNNDDDYTYTGDGSTYTGGEDDATPRRVQVSAASAALAASASYEDDVTGGWPDDVDVILNAVDDVLETDAEETAPEIHRADPVAGTPSQNFLANRKLWSIYAREWAAENPWVIEMWRQRALLAANRAGGHSVASGSLATADLFGSHHHHHHGGSDGDGDDNASYMSGVTAGTVELPPPPSLSTLGDEWADAAALHKVLDKYAKPHLNQAHRALELGCGGGRVARYLAPLARLVHAVDVAPLMLEQAAPALSEFDNVRLHLSGHRLPAQWEGRFDFVCCFDVLQHCDLHTQAAMFEQIFALLKPAGKAMVSCANLCSEGGLERFDLQKDFTVGGFYFVSEDIVRALCKRAGLHIVQISSASETNEILRRDMVVVVERADKKVLQSRIAARIRQRAEAARKQAAEEAPRAERAAQAAAVARDRGAAA